MIPSTARETGRQRQTGSAGDIVVKSSLEQFLRLVIRDHHG
jgi:hypothetical protein